VWDDLKPLWTLDSSVLRNIARLTVNLEVKWSMSRCQTLPSSSKNIPNIFTGVRLPRQRREAMRLKDRVIVIPGAKRGLELWTHETSCFRRVLFPIRHDPFDYCDFYTAHPERGSTSLIIWTVEYGFIESKYDPSISYHPLSLTLLLFLPSFLLTESQLYFPQDDNNEAYVRTKAQFTLGSLNSIQFLRPRAVCTKYGRFCLSYRLRLHGGAKEALFVVLNSHTRELVTIELSTSRVGMPYSI